MPNPRGIMTLALGLTFLLLAGCSAAPAEPGETGESNDASGSNEVLMKNMAFSPKSITVQVGEAVTWVNQDSMGHTVSADDPDQWGTPGSGDASADWMMNGERWSHTFTEPGTYQYYCKPHASGGMGSRVGMVGSIIVEA